MKRAIFRHHGDPAEVIEIIEEPDPHPRPRSEVRVRNIVMTINPADLLSIEGRNMGPSRSTLPATRQAWGPTASWTRSAMA